MHLKCVKSSVFIFSVFHKFYHLPSLVSIFVFETLLSVFDIIIYLWCFSLKFALFVSFFLSYPVLCRCYLYPGWEGQLLHLSN